MQYRSPIQPRAAQESGIEFVILFDLNTGKRFQFPKVSHEVNMHADAKMQSKGQYGDYAKRFYEVDQFDGPDYPGLYHMKTGKELLISTSLYEEIKKRNPSDPNVKTRVKQGDKIIEQIFDPVKKYIVTHQDVKDHQLRKQMAATNKSASSAEIANLVAQNELMRKQIEELTALVKGDKPAEPGDVGKGRVKRAPIEE